MASKTNTTLIKKGEPGSYGSSKLIITTSWPDHPEKKIYA